MTYMIYMNYMTCMIYMIYMIYIIRGLDMPLKQFWLYSSEGSMNAGVNASSPSVQQIVKDTHTAVAALKKVWPDSGVTIGMSGWMVKNTAAFFLIWLDFVLNMFDIVLQMLDFAARADRSAVVFR